MPSYDFKILQPGEFESLSRDLIQAHENIFLESFTDGGVCLNKKMLYLQSYYI